jgi:nitrite reductase (NADH) small subunit
MTEANDVNTWFKAVSVDEVPKNGGVCVKIDDKQIALFNFTSRKKWYACQNLCPHKLQMILSRGMIGDKQGIPKVACPFHKKSFSLESGENLDGEDYFLQTYPVKVENGYAYIGI